MAVFAIVRLNNKTISIRNEWICWKPQQKPLLTVICLDRGVFHQMIMFKCQVFGFNQLHLLDNNVNNDNNNIIFALLIGMHSFWMSHNQSADCIITTNLFDFKYIWSVGFCFVHFKFTALSIWHIDRLPNFIARHNQYIVCLGP